VDMGDGRRAAAPDGAAERIANRCTFGADLSPTVSVERAKR
jgi:hypothetical protein